MQQHYPFYLPKIEYDYSSLEPYIDTETMMVHYNKHYGTYINNLNKALENYPKYQNLNTKQLIKLCRYFPVEIQQKIMNNAGGVYNHCLYFSLLKKNEIKDIPYPLKKCIIRDFGSVDKFMEKFREKALEVFGSGYTFLVVDKYMRLKILNLKNQDTPLNLGFCPILLIDVWEHAYYLKHKNKRIDYINDFFKVINWDRVNKYLLESFK